jgi:hypothetical protein
VRVIKTRPKIRLRLPRRITPGERVRADVLLECKRAVDVSFVRATLEGWERAGSQNARGIAYQRRTVHLLAEPHGKGTLPEGVSEMRCAFDLPPELPPSYDGHRAHIDYNITVEVSVPWWRDARACFELPVAHPPRKARGRGRSLHSTAPDGPTSDEPHVEFSLNETHLLPGDTLRGELALGNVGYNRYRRARLALVGSERLGQGGAWSAAWRYQIELDVSKAAEGEPVAFAMKLPDALAPTFETQLLALEWRFEVEIECSWKKNLVAQVPMLILPPSSTVGQEASRRAARAVGDPRVLAVWERVAADRGLSLDASRALVGGFDGVEVHIAREHRGGGGVYLRGELRYPPLRLALEGGPRGALGRVLGGGPRLGLPPWDAEHFVDGREEAQVLAFAQSLLPPLGKFELTDLDDEHLVVARPGAGASHAALDGFAADVVALAQRVSPARRAVPAPAAMAAAVDAWRDLALRLGAPLETGPMAVAGKHDGVPAEVETVWSPRGEPLHTRIAVVLGEETDDEVAWAAGEPPPRALEDWPARARALWARISEGALALRRAEGRLELHDPAPRLELAALVQRLEQLLELAAALRTQQGPYR